MKIVQWVDPYTNESLTETEKKLSSKNSEYPIIDGIPKFVKENPSEPQYDIEKCFSYQWTKSEFGQPEKFSNNDIKNDVIETMDLTDEDLSLFENINLQPKLTICKLNTTVRYCLPIYLDLKHDEQYFFKSMNFPKLYVMQKLDTPFSHI